MIKTAVIGSSGYAGAELMRLISAHPNFKLESAVANSLAGASIEESFPNLQLEITHFDSMDDFVPSGIDLFFFALPHGESQKLMAKIPENAYVIDLGADYRLENKSQWLKYYGADYAGHWIYGLVDVPSIQEKLSNAKRVANPGCYATAINLSLAPFLNTNYLKFDQVNVVAASGTSGAGRKATIGLLTAENMNNLVPYKVGGTHQHTPEIEQFLNSMAHSQAKVNFTPILAPMPRGILAIVTVPLQGQIDLTQLRETFSNFYNGNPFVRLLPESVQPQTKATLGTNNAVFQLTINEEMDVLVITAAIDNLVKGAAGQAIQNANLMLGLPFDTGLTSIGVFP